MVKRIFGIILCVFALLSLLFASLVSLANQRYGEFSDGIEYETVDIYNLPFINRNQSANVALTVFEVSEIEAGTPGGDIFVVSAAMETDDNEKFMMIIGSDPLTTAGLTALYNDPAAEAVTVYGFLTEVPEATKSGILAGIMSQGISQAEAEELYNSVFIPVMMMEQTAVGSTFGTAVTFLYIMTAVFAAGGILLLVLSRRKKDEFGGFGSYNNSNTTPAYIPPGTNRQLPAAENEPFGPGKLKQPDYTDFFADKKIAEKPQKPETPKTLSTEKPLKAETPVERNAVQTYDDDTLALPSAEAMRKALGDDYDYGGDSNASDQPFSLEDLI
jgi:hypothetical protein